MGISLTLDRNPDGWDVECKNNPQAWFFHTTAWRNYQVARGATDLSCSFDNGGLDHVRIPLLVTNGEALVEGHPGPAPFCGPVNKAQTLSALDAYAKDHGITRIAFRSHPFSPCQTTGDPKNGWTWREWQTQVIDLHPATLDLWADVRKSYHALINHAEKTYTIQVDDGSRMEDFRHLHIQNAGRETRPKSTWDMMREWIGRGNGLHVYATDQRGLAASAYFEVYKECAYYGHAAAREKHVNHALIWRGMQELKARGVTQLEMGWLDYPGEEKRAVFRTGFGGEARTIYAVEKVFS